MCVQIRPNKEAAKIAYKILKTPKNLRQQNQERPPDRLRQEWFRDSSTAQ
jgi:hypothetical protein